MIVHIEAWDIGVIGPSEPSIRIMILLRKVSHVKTKSRLAKLITMRFVVIYYLLLTTIM